MKDDRTGRVLARTAPADLTIADCREGWFTVVVWCDGRCGGRYLAIDALDRWTGRKLLDLMRQGAIVCSRCKRPAVCVSVSSSERADTILRWRLGDDALPSSVVAGDD